MTEHGTNQRFVLTGMIQAIVTQRCLDLLYNHVYSLPLRGITIGEMPIRIMRVLFSLLPYIDILPIGVMVSDQDVAVFYKWVDILWDYCLDHASIPPDEHFKCDEDVIRLIHELGCTNYTCDELARLEGKAKSG